MESKALAPSRIVCGACGAELRASLWNREYRCAVCAQPLQQGSPRAPGVVLGRVVRFLLLAALGIGIGLGADRWIPRRAQPARGWTAPFTRAEVKLPIDFQSRLHLRLSLYLADLRHDPNYGVLLRRVGETYLMMARLNERATPAVSAQALEQARQYAERLSSSDAEAAALLEQKIARFRDLRWSEYVEFSNQGPIRAAALESAVSLRPFAGAGGNGPGGAGTGSGGPGGPGPAPGMGPAPVIDGGSASGMQRQAAGPGSAPPVLQGPPPGQSTHAPGPRPEVPSYSPGVTPTPSGGYTPPRPPGGAPASAPPQSDTSAARDDAILQSNESIQFRRSVWAADPTDFQAALDYGRAVESRAETERMYAADEQARTAVQRDWLLRAAAIYEEAAGRVLMRIQKATLLVSAADVYNRLKERERQYASLKRAVEHAPTSPTLWRRLQEVCFVTGRKDEYLTARREMHHWRLPELVLQ